MTTDAKYYNIWCGLDVGKSFHHVCALDANNERVFDKQINQDESEIRKVFARLSDLGRVLVIVDQINTIGALTSKGGE